MKKVFKNPSLVEITWIIKNLRDFPKHTMQNFHKKKTPLNHGNMQNIEHIMGMIWFAICKGFLQPKKKIVII
jgi:hypothetical protein